MASKKDKPEEEVVYTKPTSQVDLEQRLDADEPDPHGFLKSVNPDPNLGSEDGYVGTDPVYQNHAVDTDEPLAAEEGADKAAEEHFADAYGDGSGPSDAVKENYGAVTVATQGDQSTTEDADTSTEEEADEEDEDETPDPHVAPDSGRQS